MANAARRAARPLRATAGAPCPTKVTARTPAFPEEAPREDEAVGEPAPELPDPEAVELPLGAVALEAAPLAVAVVFAAAEGGVPGFSTEKG